MQHGIENLKKVQTESEQNKHCEFQIEGFNFQYQRSPPLSEQRTSKPQALASFLQDHIVVDLSTE